MERVSSVTAFVARYLAAPESDPQAHDCLQSLHPLERRALELLGRVPDAEARRRALESETREPWEAARHDRLESRALLRLQHELQARGLLAA